MPKAIKLFCAMFCTLCFSSMVHAATPPLVSKSLQWLDTKSNFFEHKILANTSLPDGLPGSVAASRTDANGPDYHYHWVRDAALTMLALIDLYQFTNDGNTKAEIRNTLSNYIDFSAYIQNVPKQTDLGEPKFYLDGRAYDQPWGRPQNDSPALRAISLIEWANILFQEHQDQQVHDRLYNSNYPATSPIKKDLEYISHHWKDPSFDLWEEVQGTHFYTLMVIRRALLQGAELARRMDDPNAADWYYSQAKQIELELTHFWDEQKGYITATINRTGGIDYKSTNLDTAVILGLLHGGMNDGFMAWDDPHVLATLNKLSSTFKSMYAINQTTTPGVAIGRYPEDRYAGTNFSGGNPWTLCTLALAEAWYHYANVQRLHHQTNFESLKLADKFIQRVHFHANSDDSMDEQIQRDTGKMTSAKDLTWNYAALLTTRKAGFDAVSG